MCIYTLYTFYIYKQNLFRELLTILTIFFNNKIFVKNKTFIQNIYYMIFLILKKKSKI